MAVCSYELYQMATENRLEPQLETLPNATFEALEGYYQHLESFLLKIGYLYPHTAAARMEKFRQFYHRPANGGGISPPAGYYRSY